MRKALVLLLALGILAPAFADDAKVLPAGVFRLTFVFASEASDEMFQDDGERIASPIGKMSALALGGAVEYGLTDQITAAVQWTPAYVFSTSIEAFPNAHFDGLADLFLGAKIQILGADGFIPNETFRAAVAPGLLLPLDRPDWVEEAAAAGAGDEFKISSPSLRAVGLGFRAYFDWVISELFFLNLYNQTIFYLPVEKDNILTPGVENEYEDGYSLTFEIEPHFNYALSDSLSVSAGVPLTWTMRPETVIDGVGNDEPFSLLTVSPSVSAFVMTTLPIELEVGYTLPLAGRNAPAAGTLVVQLKTFLRF